MITAPQLFAGITDPVGDHACYYCGGVCGEDHPTKTYVKPTFTNRDIVLRPASEYICDGCVACFVDRDITLADGERRKKQRTRLYSWVFTGTTQTAYSKAHMRELTEAILNPPPPPFGIVVATSGKKQLLFRAVVAMSRTNVALLFEDEQIVVEHSELREKLRMARKICAATGKPALATMGVTSACMYYDYYGGWDDTWESWRAEKSTATNRLAGFLTPSGKECQNEHPRSAQDEPRRVPAQTSLFD